MAEFMGLIKELKVFKSVTKGIKAPLKELNSGFNMLFGKKRGDLTKLNSGQIMKGGKLGVKGTSQKAFESTPLTGGQKISKILKSPFAGIGKAAKIATKPMGMLARGALRLGGVPKGKAKAMVGAMGALGKTALMGGMLGGVFGIFMMLMDAMNPFKPLLEALSTIFGVYGAILEQAFMPVIEMLFAVMLDPAVIAMFQMLSDVFMQIVVALLPLIQIMMPFATMIMMALIIPLQMLAPVIQLLMIPLAWLGSVMEGFNTVLQNVLANWDTYVAPVFVALDAFFLLIANAWNTYVSPIFSAAGAVFGLIGVAWDTHIDPVFDAIGGVFGLLGEAWDEYVKPVFNGIKSFFLGIVNGIIGVFNAPITTLNEIPGVNLATIPTVAMATGGITMGPGFKYLGDNPSGNEAVIPLDDPKASKMLGGGPEMVYQMSRLEDQQDKTNQILMQIYSQSRRQRRTL